MLPVRTNATCSCQSRPQRGGDWRTAPVSSHWGCGQARGLLSRVEHVPTVLFPAAAAAFFRAGVRSQSTLAVAVLSARKESRLTVALVLLWGIRTISKR